MFTFNHEEVGKRLYSLRTSRKLSLEAVGKAVDTSRQTISTYEKGTAKYDSEILCRLSMLFNVSTDYLLGLSDVPQRDATAEDVFKELERVKANYQKYIADIKSITEKQNALQ